MCGRLRAGSRGERKRPPPALRCATGDSLRRCGAARAPRTAAVRRCLASRNPSNPEALQIAAAAGAPSASGGAERTVQSAGHGSGRGEQRYSKVDTSYQRVHVTYVLGAGEHQTARQCHHGARAIVGNAAHDARGARAEPKFCQLCALHTVV